MLKGFRQRSLINRLLFDFSCLWEPVCGWTDHFSVGMKLVGGPNWQNDTVVNGTVCTS